jgi:hypothetical protein
MVKIAITKTSKDKTLSQGIEKSEFLCTVALFIEM